MSSSAPIMLSDFEEASARPSNCVVIPRKRGSSALTWMDYRLRGNDGSQGDEIESPRQLSDIAYQVMLLSPAIQENR